MEQQVSDEVQAAMALKLADDVRQMIREEIKTALEDPNFVSGLGGYFLMQHLLNQGIGSSNSFIGAVKQVITNQMNKY